jgi:tetratricopeptide (TPR) repeat protein
MPSISLCVIARDEEAFLPGLLQSVQALVDQVVLVDTGSVDQTKNIAEAAGALVVEQEWQDDFAGARNCALEHATGDWILVLDCDERLSPESVDVIRNAVTKNDFDLGMMALHNAKSLDSDTASILDGTERQGDPVLLPRLIRRTSDLQWSGVIHESISKWMALEKRSVKRIQADILHFGCVPEVLNSRQKDARNLKLLEKRCAAEPNNPGIRTHLAQVYLHNGEPEKAMEAVEMAWTSMARNRQMGGPQVAIVPLATLRAYIQIRTDQISAALETLNQAVAWGGDHANLEVLQGVCRETQALNLMGDARKSVLNKAKVHFEKALSSAGSVDSNERIPGATTWASQTRLATTCLMLGQIEEATAGFYAAIDAKPDHLEAQLGLSEAILFGGNPELAIELAAPHCAAGCPDAWIISACASDVLADTESVRLFTQKAYDLRAKAFVAPHRRIQLEALLCASSIYEGKPKVGPGTLGVVGALMGRHPIEDKDVIVRGANAAGIQSLVRNVVQAGQSDLLNALFTRRAESLIPGIAKLVAAELEKINGVVEDDGEPEYLFIGGAGRSGTTLLRAMLDAHENISVGPERKLIRSICGMRADWLRSSKTLEEAGVTEDIFDDAVRAFISSLMENTGNGAVRIGEKTPPNLLYMNFLGKIYPQARFVHVIRDGRAVSSSLLKQNWVDATTGEPLSYCSSPEHAGRYWAEMVQEIRSQAASVPGRYLEVRYEDLVTRPRETLSIVLAFLDEPWDEAVMAHQDADCNLPTTESSSAAVAQPVHTNSLSRWQSELSTKDLNHVLTSAAPLLKELGYVS